MGDSIKDYFDRVNEYERLCEMYCQRPQYRGGFFDEKHAKQLLDFHRLMRKRA